MRRTSVCILAIVVPVLLLVALLDSLPARAAGVVGDGTPQSCTFEALQDALQGGGLVTFDCGPAQHTIVVTVAGGIEPAPNTIIDGGERITLSGNGMARLLDNPPDMDTTLANITLSDGYSASQPGGAIRNRGNLVLQNVLVQNSFAQTPTLSAGAIYNAAGGVLLLHGSTVRNNHSAGGGAILNELSSHFTVVDSQIISNVVDGGHGGAILNAGLLTMTNSIVSANTVRFENITPARTGGGAISNLFTGRATLTWVTLSNNVSGADCGAILNRGLLNINYGAVSDNVAAQGDGGAICNVKTQPYDIPVANLAGVTVSGNAAGTGGAIVNDQGSIVISTTTVSNNTATSSGGGLWNRLGTIELLNVTISANSVITSGGGIWNDRGDVNLVHATLSGNSASQGGGIYNVDAVGTETQLVNSIIAGSLSGGNCQGRAVTSSSYTLSSDETCALVGNGDENDVDPLLSTLGHYGGPTQVHMIAEDSPAIDAVSNGNVPATDQRGTLRPQGEGADIGAVERHLHDSRPLVFLPMVTR